MKLRKLAFILPLFGSLPLLSCKNSPSTITVAEVTHSVFYAPLYVAKNAGFFEDEGINIDIITTPGADKTMSALLSKDASIGLMGPEASVYVYNRGQVDYAVNFAQLTQRDGSFLLGRDKQENFSYEMLKGKTVIGGVKER